MFSQNLNNLILILIPILICLLPSLFPKLQFPLIAKYKNHNTKPRNFICSKRRWPHARRPQRRRRRERNGRAVGAPSSLTRNIKKHIRLTWEKYCVLLKCNLSYLRINKVTQLCRRPRPVRGKVSYSYQFESVNTKQVN